MFDVLRSSPVRRFALGALLACVASGAAVAAQPGDAEAPSWVEQRVSGLEQKLAFFGERPERRGEPSYVQPAQSSSMADIAVRLDRLENQMRQLNGRLEQLEFQSRKNDEALKRFQGDVDYRFQDLESGKGGGAKPGRRSDVGPASGSSGPAQIGSSSGPGAPPASLGASRSADSSDAIGGLLGSDPGDDPDGPMSIQPPGLSRGDAGPARGPSATASLGDGGGVVAGSGSARDQFDLGVGFMQRRNYDQAEATFRDFLRSYPNDAKAPEARYWLGESLYQRRKYTDAADSFFTIYKEAPQSSKAPESMLKLGMSLNGMGKKEEACATIAEAGRKYARIKAQSDRELKRISC
ncbi:tol-pal system protein YbgF [Hansschlegelia beijingensis]|uniref:Cell division coordinator CpoB n=1 Tax=Hansschlegelia beijingensis TaxID=1133344 RepID=A0A7W6D3I2_9HYPH|nr:tol-pal system protein YbgF [Hansschlegelia beijingensis]MBB3971504.1 tol-pal system protein YbgF [Hansschlegelia beijingensis]